MMKPYKQCVLFLYNKQRIHNNNNKQMTLHMLNNVNHFVVEGFRSIRLVRDRSSLAFDVCVCGPGQRELAGADPCSGTTSSPSLSPSCWGEDGRESPWLLHNALSKVDSLSSTQVHALQKGIWSHDMRVPHQ